MRNILRGIDWLNVLICVVAGICAAILIGGWLTNP